MQLDSSIAGQVKITIFDYIQEMLEDFHIFDPSKTISRTPAADHIFKVRDDQPKLDEQKAQTFHTFTAKALFATKRARPDIHTSVCLFNNTRNMPRQRQLEQTYRYDALSTRYKVTTSDSKRQLNQYCEVVG